MQKAASRESRGKETENITLYAIIRLRGRVNVNPEVKKTLELLRLTRKYSLAIYPSDIPGLEGMLKKVKDWVTWGEIDRDTLKILLERRGRTPGNRRLTEKYIRDEMGLKDMEELVEKIFRGEILLHKQNHIKPIFRLHPPSGGFKRSIKRPFRDQGELGYRGPLINELIRRMA